MNFEACTKKVALETYTLNLMFCWPCMGRIFLYQTWGCRFLSDLDVGACFFYENVPIETLKSFESTLNK